MKKNLRYFMTLLLMMVASVGWGADKVHYTLDGTQTGGSNGYATESEITQNGIEWRVTGNTTANPWRIGGKNLENVNREVYSKTAMGSAISKVVLEVGTITLSSVNSITLIVASNSDFTTVLQTIEKTDITANTTLTFTPTSSEWDEGAYYKFVFNVTAGSSNNYYIQLKSAKFYKNEVVAVEAPTFSVAEGTYTSAKSVELSCVTPGATIYYTTDGAEPTSASTPYTGAISISKTTTLKAIAVKGEDVSSVATATYTIVAHAGTEADPYTVADARAAIDAGTGININNVYATGIVSEIVTAYSSQYGNISYNISADGLTTDDQLQAYRGKSYNGDNFTSEDDIQVGDVVVIYGNLKKHNDTYEFDANNQLVSLARPQITPITGDCYEKVTSTADITDGEYLIVYEDGNVAFDGSLETLDAVGNTIPVTIVENKIAATGETNAATFTINTTNGTLKSASGKYIGVSSNSNGLKQTAESDTYTHSFSIDADGNAVIAAVFDGSTMALRYNKASNQTRFRYYNKDSQEAIQLYKKVVYIKTAESGYTTLVSGEALDIKNLPDGLTAYYVTADGVSTEKVTLTQVTAAVPAETPLIFKGTATESYEIPTATSGTALSNNQLAGFSTEPTTFQNDGDAYILSGGEFHPTKAGTFPAGKAYLNVSTANAKALTISFAETNGINNVNVENNTNEKIFNLAGQQMKSAVKGVYIKNGKKYIK